MPKPRPLTAGEAKRTLANRFGPRADRLRQFSTKFGIRPYRCWLVWTKWTGTERGEGKEVTVKRVEILPTPKVTDLTSQALSAFTAGVLPAGSIKVTEISATLTQDQLTGKAYPVNHEDAIPEGVSFYWELVEDGRGDPEPVRAKNRLASVPFRAASMVQWVAMLERISEDANRDGSSAYGGR